MEWTSVISKCNLTLGCLRVWCLLAQNDYENISSLSSGYRDKVILLFKWSDNVRHCYRNLCLGVGSTRSFRTRRATAASKEKARVDPGGICSWFRAHNGAAAVIEPPSTRIWAVLVPRTLVAVDTTPPARSSYRRSRRVTVSSIGVFRAWCTAPVTNGTEIDI